MTDRAWVRRQLEEGREPREIQDQLFREGMSAAEARQLVDDVAQELERADDWQKDEAASRQSSEDMWWLDLSDIGTWINGAKILIYLLCAVSAFQEVATNEGWIGGDAAMFLISFVGTGSILLGMDVDTLFSPRLMGYEYDTNLPVFFATAVVYLIFQLVEFIGLGLSLGFFGL